MDISTIVEILGTHMIIEDNRNIDMSMFTADDVPPEIALRAAQKAEAAERFSCASKFYAAAGKPKDVKRIADRCVERGDDYFAREAYALTGTEEGIALNKFIETNIIDGPHRLIK